MIPTLGETLLALAGLWRFVREGAPALRWFDRSMAGFWRSFGVAVIAAPLQALLIATQTAAPADGAGWFRLIAVEASAYVMLWVAFPLALYHIAARLDRVPQYVDFVIVYNWTNIPWLVISLVVTLLASSGVVPGAAVQVLAGILYIGILSFEWFIARQTLRLGGLACAGLVALDFAITIVVESAVTSMSGA
jgi:hypothetical protein